MEIVEPEQTAVNDSRTLVVFDPELTHDCSADVPTFERPPLPFDPIAVRDRIYIERNVVGRRSNLGQHYSKLGEQIENFLKANSQDQVDRLASQMILTHKAIRKLNRVRVAAPSLPKGERA